MSSARAGAATTSSPLAGEHLSVQRAFASLVRPMVAEPGGVVVKHPWNQECRTVLSCVHGRSRREGAGGARWCNYPPDPGGPRPRRRQLRSRRRESDLGSPSPSSNGHQALGGRGHKSHTGDPSEDATVPRGFCEWTTAVSGRGKPPLIIERDLNAPCMTVLECGQRSNLPPAFPLF